jgi:hypothetical protein
MDDLIRAAAANLDLQLVRIAVALEGGEAGAKRLIDNMARGRAHPGAASFVEEAAAILKVRRLLAVALVSAPCRPRIQRFHFSDGGRVETLPAA